MRNKRKGFTIHAAGYIVIWVNGERVLEHRHIMSQHIGRPLLQSERVHHINENKTDNRIENLLLCSSQKEHNHQHKKLFHSETHKQCRECLQILNRDNFWVSISREKSGRDTHQPNCKACCKIAKRRSYANVRGGNVRKASFRDTTHKQCTLCQEIKERSLFPPDKAAASKGFDPHSSWCLSCCAQRERDRRAKKSAEI